jgi:hypothetical protein
LCPRKGKHVRNTLIGQLVLVERRHDAPRVANRMSKLIEGEATATREVWPEAAFSRLAVTVVTHLIP